MTIFDYNNEVVYNPVTKKMDILQRYEIEGKTDNTDKAEELLLNYLRMVKLLNILL